MKTEISICSRSVMEHMIRHHALKHTAVISFYDPPYKQRGEEPVDFSGACDRVFLVGIHDLDPSALPAVGLTVDTYFPEADDLATFIYEAWQSGLGIICQCEYGQSRSAACAAAILEHFAHRGIDVFRDYRYYPNQLVFNKVLAALERYATARC